MYTNQAICYCGSQSTCSSSLSGFFDMLALSARLLINVTAFVLVVMQSNHFFSQHSSVCLIGHVSMPCLSSSLMQTTWISNLSIAIKIDIHLKVLLILWSWIYFSNSGQRRILFERIIQYALLSSAHIHLLNRLTFFTSLQSYLVFAVDLSLCYASAPFVRLSGGPGVMTIKQ